MCNPTGNTSADETFMEIVPTAQPEVQMLCDSCQMI